MSVTTAIKSEATTYAAIKIAGHAVSISKKENGALKSVPLKIDGNDRLVLNPCYN